MKDLGDYLKNFSGNKVLMTVFPHPDDETMGTGGLLVAAKKLGFKTIVISLTAGGAGKVHMNLNGKSLVETRRLELQLAAKMLQADEVIIGDFDDARLKSSIRSWQPWLKKLLAKYQPGIVVTYDHSGFSGHPDHIVLSIELKKLIDRDATLFWVSSHGYVRDRLLNKNTREFAPYSDYQLDINYFKKWLAVRKHRSQSPGKNLPIPLLLAFILFGRKEWYHKVDLKKEYPYKFVPFEL